MKRKILFVIPSLAGGGAERVMIMILRQLDRSCWDPLVIVFEDRNDYRHEWPPDIPISSLNKKGRWSFLRLVWQLAKVIRETKPSLVVPFLTYTNYLTVLAWRLAKVNIPLLLSHQNILTHSSKNERFRSIKLMLVRNLYPKATGVLVVSNAIKRDLAVNHKIPEHKCNVIYNPVAIDRVRSLAAEKVDHPWFSGDIPIIAACGRLTTQKNYPLLLRAMRLVLKRLEVRLVILGKGPHRAELENYARDLGISPNVSFLGFQENPFKYIARASAFVLSSSWEGLPLVLLEAMACSTPVISTRCPSGPDEIITDGADGLLVPVGDERALADAISRVLTDELLKKRLGDAGRKKADDFRIEKIVGEYEKIFREYASRMHHSLHAEVAR